MRKCYKGRETALPRNSPSIAWSMQPTNRGTRSLGPNLEEDPARSKERAKIDNLRHDVGELLGGRDKEDLDVTVLNEPTKVVLPAEKVGSLGGHTELTAKVVSSGVVNQSDRRFGNENFELGENLNNKDLVFSQHTTSGDLCLS